MFSRLQVEFCTIEFLGWFFLGILTPHDRWIMTAIQHIERLARGRSEQAVAVIKNVQQMSNIPMQEMQLALRQLLDRKSVV